MDEVVIRDVNGSGGLTFHSRSPEDRSAPIYSFVVRVTDHHLSAETVVYAGDGASGLVRMFEDMSQKWAGWSGNISWGSLENELELACGHDRFGHIGIRVILQPSHYADSWRAEATVVTEAGQLENIALEMAAFIGHTQDVSY
jgi:hypothetical protein